MATKSTTSAGPGGTQSPFPDNIRDSAHQIWLAGLGAFTKAQEEGSKVFDALVKEGMAIQQKTQSTAEEKLTEATQKMTRMATDLSAKATGQWDKLEGIFEDRVARALHSLGVPVAQDLAALAARIDQLSKAMEQLSAMPAARPAARKTAAKPVAKPAAKRSTPRKKA